MGRLFLKTFFETGVESWGVLALPRNQGAQAALRRYDGGLVLLAHPGARTGGLPGGRIFALCTLTGRGGLTRDLANPEVLDRWRDEAQRWPGCVVIAEYRRLRRPKRFAELPRCDLSRRAGELRGKLGVIELQSEAEAELRSWTDSAEAERVEVWRPEIRLVSSG